MEGSIDQRPASRPPTAPLRPRDLRADLFRGLALWFIFIDHVPGNWLANVTLRNVTLCDATEVFVLLAGYAAGIAYGGTLHREGWLFAAAQVVRRVGTLYVAHIVLFVMFTAQVGYSAAALQDSIYIDELHLDAFGQEPYRALLEALLLRFQPAFLNILPLYIVLLLQFALALPLLRRPRLLLAISFAMYVLTRSIGLELPSWTGGGWFFNPFAWQVLFAIGLALGYRAPGGPGPLLVLPWWRGLGVLAVLWLVVTFVLLFMTWHRPEYALLVPAWLMPFWENVDKTALHPFRLISVLAATYLLAHWVRADAGWLRGAVAYPFVLMGKQGLPVFCSGILFAFFGRLALEYSDGAVMQAGANIVGLGSLVAVGWLSDWYKKKERAPRRDASAAVTERAA
ncbi:MAG: OpgC domain-containing protein [Pseudomonadota bacterium]